MSKRTVGYGTVVQHPNGPVYVITCHKNGEFHLAGVGEGTSDGRHNGCGCVFQSSVVDRRNIDLPLLQKLLGSRWAEFRFVKSITFGEGVETEGTVGENFEPTLSVGTFLRSRYGRRLYQVINCGDGRVGLLDVHAGHTISVIRCDKPEIALTAFNVVGWDILSPDKVLAA
jgi:hypothetical protein